MAERALFVAVLLLAAAAVGIPVAAQMQVAACRVASALRSAAAPGAYHVCPAKGERP
jgi:hypothetical protein